MRTLIDTDASRPNPALLIVLLTGTYSEPEDFVREGFTAAVRERGIAAEIAMTGTRASEVADASIVASLHELVILPARLRGRRRVWIAGISLGALAALAYAARHESEVEGLVLLSPYPGTREVLREIDASGGLASWRPGIGAGGDVEREAWSWLGRRGASPPVHLYYGTRDRFADGQRRMARALGNRDAREIDGGHDWPAWREQWSLFLDEHGAALG
jgi:pimeloyl-ACP methyl ester carboxylesterase